MTWTSPHELRDQLVRYWQRGDILRARLTGETLFPLVLRLHKPGARDLSERFAEVADWVAVLRDGATHGYTVHWKTQRHRVHGTNDLPDGVTMDSERAALRWIGRGPEAEHFSELAARILTLFPVLRGWLEQHPLRVLEHEHDWGDVLKVLAWFSAHPKSGVYLRELDIPGIHTKFIESRRGLLAELLDTVLPPVAIAPDATGLHGFNRRYGLADKPALVRLRLLDKRFALHGLTDFAARVGELAHFDPGPETVFVTENEVNFLAFPEFPNALVIFGGGYSVDVLQGLSWLAHKRVHYWGDIDTHGFAILNRFRQPFPDARSLLMDRATLEAYRAVWGHEDPRKRFTGELARLTDAEQVLYQALREDQLAPALRLEQEHIAQHWLLRALRSL